MKTIRHGEAIHGKKTKEYSAWARMKERCYNPNFKDSDIYMGRGIKVCDRWSLYENFLTDMGRAPGSEYSLDRINPNGNYEPSNCRWATASEQSNNKRNTIYLSYLGQTKSLANWCADLNLNQNAVRHRIRRGWPIELAFSHPVKT